MRLYQLIPEPGQSASIMCKCEKWTPLKEAMADLDAPFGTFYCSRCLAPELLRPAMRKAIEKC